ncbi:hypothetical protein CSUI_004607, partial [Cystoisospora suis]
VSSSLCKTAPRACSSLASLAAASLSPASVGPWRFCGGSVFACTRGKRRLCSKACLACCALQHCHADYRGNRGAQDWKDNFPVTRNASHMPALGRCARAKLLRPRVAHDRSPRRQRSLLCITAPRTA